MFSSPKPQNPKTPKPLENVYFGWIAYYELNKCCANIFWERKHWLDYSLKVGIAHLVLVLDFHLCLPCLSQILPVYQEDVVEVKFVILCTYLSASSFLRKAMFSTYCVLAAAFRNCKSFSSSSCLLVSLCSLFYIIYVCNKWFIIFFF